MPTGGDDRFDLFTLEGGYSYKKGKFEGQASAAKFWFNSNSYNVKSEITALASVFAGYDFGFVKPTLMPSLNFGSKTDFALTFGLEHSFYFLDDALQIVPTINANGSTQNYYNSYYKLRRYKLLARIIKVQITGQVLNASQFKMLDYEGSLPINYVFKKFTLNFTPYYAIPVNPSVIAITRQKNGQAPKTVTGTEKLQNWFFFQASIAYKF